MAETLIYESHSQMYSLMDFYGCYGMMLDPAPFSLSIGAKYKVVWGSEEYICEAYDGSFLLSGVIYMGNTSNFGIDGDNVPFLIVYWSNGGAIDILSINDTEQTSHSFGIYSVGNVGNKDIVIKDRDGTDMFFSGINTLRLNKSDGDTQIFSKGEAVSDVPISLDFTGGNQIIEAPEGTLVKSAVLLKPDDLIPSNILKGAEIGGIEGTLFVPQGQEITVDPDFSEGNIQFVPDEGTMFSKVTVNQPETLVPANIVKGVVIAGVEGIYEGSGGSGELDENLKYFVYNIDIDAHTITIHAIDYNKIFADTGSYDVVIPDIIFGMSVILKCV